MKAKLLLAITTIAMLGSASLFAGGDNRPYVSGNAPARPVFTPVNVMKCDTMSIAAPLHQGGTVTVSCKHYAGIRPDDCRRACASK